MIVHYGSTAEIFAAYMTGADRFSDHSELKWYGNESKADTIRLAQNGDTRLVAKAEEVLTQLDTAIETPRKVWDRSPAGAFCSVPDVLAGLPTPMRRQREAPDDRAPITILVDTSSSAGITADVLRRRGTTILALVMALTRIRPVTLRQITTLDGYRDLSGETVITSAINTTPLDLATACYVLTSSGFSRRLTYQLARHLNDFRGGWPRSYTYGNTKPYYADLVLRLGYDPKTTLMIEAPELHDEVVTNPILWVNRQIAHFTTNAEEETY